jgi:hypothetical protein
MLRLSTPKNDQIDRPEHEDYPYVDDQPQPDVMAKEQDVEGDDDDNHRDHVQNERCLFTH